MVKKYKLYNEPFYKYKLIKEYPASPPLNTILERRSILTRNYALQKHCNWFPYLIEPEKYPEYWEQVIDWEDILKRAEKDYPKGTIYSQPNNRFHVSSGKFIKHESEKTLAIFDNNGGYVWKNWEWCDIKEKPKKYTLDEALIKLKELSDKELIKEIENGKKL